MSRTITETTSPATADCGMRTFSIVSESGESEFQVCVLRLENRAAHDEPIQRMEVHDSVPENRDTGRALCALASRLLESPGASIQ